MVHKLVKNNKTGEGENFTFVLDWGDEKYYTEKVQNISKLSIVPPFFGV